MKTSIITLVSFLLLILSSSCNSKNEKESSEMDGVYESLGYGRILKIEDGEYIVADVTKFSCIPLLSGELEEVKDFITYKKDTIHFKNGINLYHFIRVGDAPPICKKGSPERAEAEARANDPEHNFETLWDTFKTHYAYFELRNVDPENMYKKYRPQVTSETSEAELFFIMYSMLEEFDDGHIGIEASDEVELAAKKLFTEKNESEENTKPTEKLRNYKVADLVANKYISEGTSIKNNNLRWGIIKNNIGYLQINQMMGLIDFGISDTLSYRDYWMAYFEKLDALEEDDSPMEVAAIDASMDVIIEEFKNTDAIIIDVRFNGGGKDEVGMNVLQRFTDKEKIAFTKKARLGDGYTPTNSVIQPASEKAYNKPVFLLIGPESASATEIMALSALSMSNITLIGSKTEGVFSDILDKELPNGWEFGLSNEVYLDLQGNNYEGLGIPPDIEIGYERATQKFLEKVVGDLKVNGDAAILKAIEKLNN